MSGIAQMLLTGAAPKPSYSYITQTFGGSGTTVTFSGVSIGDEDPSRRVVVCLTAPSGSSRRVNSFLIAGGSAGGTQNTSSSLHNSVWSRVVASGTTADIEITMDGNVYYFGIAVYALYNLSSGLTASASNTVSSATSNTDTVAVQEDGILIASHLNGGFGTVSTTWTNVTEDFDSGVRSSASAQGLAEDAAYSVTAAWSGSNASRLVLAAWR